MRQRIPLTDYNKDILIRVHGIKPEELIQKYWVNKIMSDQDLIFDILNNKRGARDPQRRILIRANRMMMKNIYQTLNLPGRSGSAVKQRKWFKIVKDSGLKLTERLCDI